jgi:hypothetical protein
MANRFAAWTEFVAMENPPILQVIPRKFEYTRMNTS